MSHALETNNFLGVPQDVSATMQQFIDSVIRGSQAPVHAQILGFSPFNDFFWTNADMSSLTNPDSSLELLLHQESLETIAHVVYAPFFAIPSDDFGIHCCFWHQSPTLVKIYSQLCRWLCPGFLPPPPDVQTAAAVIAGTCSLGNFWDLPPWATCHESHVAEFISKPSI
jgi:hypothetical protein